MRRPIVDFYHLFDDDDIFQVPVILIVKKSRFRVSFSTLSRSKISVSTRSRSSVGFSTLSVSKIGIGFRSRTKLAVSTISRLKTQG